MAFFNKKVGPNPFNLIHPDCPMKSETDDSDQPFTQIRIPNDL
jgi:hypothetical protein